MKYHVVTSDTLIGIIERVNELIPSGFEPQGGIQVILNTDGSFAYFQAMVQDPNGD